MPIGRKISKTEKHTCKQLYTEGWTYQQISVKTGISRSAVHRAVNNLYVKPKKHYANMSLQPRVKSRNFIKRETTSVSAFVEDHELVKDYAKLHDLPRHEALHELITNNKPRHWLFKSKYN